MANAIMTQELAETIAATTKQNIPVVRYINSELSDKLGEGSGDAAVAGSIQFNFTVSDMFGNDTGIARTFVVFPNPATANGSYPVTAGAATVNIAKVNLVSVNPGTGVVTKQTGAVPNTVLTGTAGTAFLCPLLSGTKYYTGAVFASKAVAFASIQPKPYGGNADRAGSSLDSEVNIRISTIAAGLEGVDRWRIDVLYGVAPLYGNGAVALYCQAL